MKKIFLLGLVAIFFTSCQNSGPPRYVTNSPEIDVTKALVKDYENGNWENWGTHYADTAKVFHNSLEGITAQELQEGLKNTLKSMSSYRFNEKEMFIEMIFDDKGDTWVYFWGIWEAKVADINKELAMPVHIALQFVNNKIVREYAYYDPSSINMAIIELEGAILEEVEELE